MSDLISRQAAIDALAKNMPSWTTPDGSGQFDHDIQVTDEAYVDCMQIIHDMPSAQPETSILTVTVNSDSEEIERVARKIKDAPVMVLPSAEPERKKGNEKCSNELPCGWCSLFDTPCFGRGGEQDG